MSRFLISFFLILFLLIPNAYANDNNLNENDNINEQETTLNINEDDNSNTEEDIIEEKNDYDYKKYKVDFSKIKDNRLKLNNDLRDSLGKDSYFYYDKLDTTAQEWAEFMLNKGEATHRRNSGDSYYNYKKITNWFKKRNIEFQNINRATFSESIGYGNYTCNRDDCTEEINKSVKRVYDRYMEEKNKAYQPHYKAMIKTEFKKIGLGLAIKDLGKNRFEFYLTVHYGTEIL